MRIGEQDLIERYGPVEIANIKSDLEKLETTPLGQILRMAFSRERNMLQLQLQGDVSAEKYSAAQATRGQLEQLENVFGLTKELLPGTEELFPGLAKVCECAMKQFQEK